MMNRHTLFATILLSVIYCAPSLATEYLDEKTAFCNSQKDLGEYLRFAKHRNLSGMNRLVIAGNCDFVPDGERLQISDYQTEKIETVTVIAFEVDERTRWTFKAFINTQN